MLNIGEFARLGQVSPRMLRHYDEAGLLKPKNVDPANGYRSYEFGQLGRLHRLMALRDLGFTLDQIRSTLDQDPSVEQLRGMLSLRQRPDRGGDWFRAGTPSPGRSSSPITRREHRHVEPRRCSENVSIRPDRGVIRTLHRGSGTRT